MAVTIDLMNNASKDIVVNKSLSTIASLSGDFRATVDALRPTIIVDGAVASNVNYAYIPDFGRYYYVTDRQELTKDLTELSLYTDVLKSFATQLANASGIVKRNENNYDMYLDDNKIPISARKAIAIRRFSGTSPFGATARSISLTVFGGNRMFINPT